MIQSRETLAGHMNQLNDRYLNQSDNDKVSIEKGNLRISNLEKLIEDLNNQVDVNEKAYKQELEKNKKIVDAQTDLLVKYKKV